MGSAYQRSSTVVIWTTPPCTTRNSFFMPPPLDHPSAPFALRQMESNSAVTEPPPRAPQPLGHPTICLLCLAGPSAVWAASVSSFLGHVNGVPHGAPMRGAPGLTPKERPHAVALRLGDLVPVRSAEEPVGIGGPPVASRDRALAHAGHGQNLCAY